VLVRKEFIWQEISNLIITLLAFAVLISFIIYNINMIAHFFVLFVGFLLLFLCLQ
ncbi:rhomboid family intramembrane serine protease, partial [Bacillus subtilis]|nr:rhomboid family intramembrane serine protease [Bacillus subtilis]